VVGGGAGGGGGGGRAGGRLTQESPDSTLCEALKMDWTKIRRKRPTFCFEFRFEPSASAIVLF